MLRWIAALVLSLLAAAATAHPHVWIEHSVAVVYDKAGSVHGVHLVWAFDEMYSTMLKTEFTAAKDGTLGPADVKRIEKEAFINLQNYNWFVEAKLNERPLKITKAESFAVRFDARGRAIYDFALAFEPAAPAAENRLEVTVFDPDFFIDYLVPPTADVTVEGRGDAPTKCKIIRDVKRNTLYGPVATDKVVCKWAGK